MIKQEASATDSDSKIRTALLSSSRSRVSLESNRNQYYFFLFSSSFASSNVVQGWRGEARIRIRITARPEENCASENTGGHVRSDQQERILAQLAHDDAPVVVT